MGARELRARRLEGRCLICGDSKLVVNQMAGAWKCRDAKLAALRAQVATHLDGLDYHIVHVDRALNAKADDLANLAMNTRQSGAWAPATRDESKHDRDDDDRSLVEESSSEQRDVAVVDAAAPPASIAERRRLLRIERDASAQILESLRDHATAQLELVEQRYRDGVAALDALDGLDDTADGGSSQ
mmetsp:Transcript_17203/g.69214  ORF Transcript_17203/g.69214 Transcript_17203/m.69214 type:complete len:186 (-) Transcript_17203:1232-1789(-)